MATALREKTGEPWSKMDIVDLQSGLAFGTSIEAIADFLTRSIEEVRKKAASLKGRPHLTAGATAGTSTMAGHQACRTARP
jgi:hypothetical protein